MLAPCSKEHRRDLTPAPPSPHATDRVPSVRCGHLELQDSMLEPAPENDLLAQLEAKMEGQVTAYLERMREVCG